MHEVARSIVTDVTDLKMAQCHNVNNHSVIEDVKRLKVELNIEISRGTFRTYLRQIKSRHAKKMSKGCFIKAIYCESSKIKLIDYTDY